MTTKPEMTLENVCFRYDGSKEASSTSQISKWEYIRDMYIQKIHFGTPETAFTILCQAIDFIDANGGEEGK